MAPVLTNSLIFDPPEKTDWLVRKLNKDSRNDDAMLDSKPEYRLITG